MLYDYTIMWTVYVINAGVKNVMYQGFIQKFLFGVEGGVALSRTVPP